MQAAFRTLSPKLKGSAVTRIATKLLACASITAMLLAGLSAAVAQPAAPQLETDPIKLGTMTGFPPAPERVVSKANILKPQNSRWAFRHLREIYPTRAVQRSDKPKPLVTKARDLSGVQITTPAGEKLTVAEWQRRTFTDALVVLRNGRVEYESYAPGMSGRTQHALWSMSKSMVGLMAMIAIEEGKLDPKRAVTEYLPELKGTGWDGATVENALDMRAGVAYRETFSDPTADIFRYLFAGGLLVPPPTLPVSKNLYEYLATIKPAGTHGGRFEYQSVDTEVVGWILQRVYDRRLSEILADRVWSRIGAQDDAYYIVDPYGIDIASVGLAASALDLARLGQTLSDSANRKGKLLGTTSLDVLRDGSTREAFAKSVQASVRTGYSYRNQWWMPNDADGTIEAKGLFGQHLVINPKENVVIVKLSTNPSGDTISTHALDKAAFAAIIDYAGK
jgi:CubicO group peptidase (beta-lactamase class C family)